MKFLRLYIKFINAINEKIGYAVGWLTSLLVIVVCYDVFTRYFMKESRVAIQELEWHLFAIIFLIGAAYTLKYDRHVRVDVLYTRFSHQRKAWINLIGSILFLIPFCLLVIWASRNFVIDSFRIHETSPDPGGLPGRYILKSMIPFGFFLLLLQAIALAFHSILTISNLNEKGIDER